MFNITGVRKLEMKYFGHLKKGIQTANLVPLSYSILHIYPSGNINIWKKRIKN